MLAALADVAAINETSQWSGLAQGTRSETPISNHCLEQQIVCRVQLYIALQCPCNHTTMHICGVRQTTNQKFVTKQASDLICIQMNEVGIRLTFGAFQFV